MRRHIWMMIVLFGIATITILTNTLWLSHDLIHRDQLRQREVQLQKQCVTLQTQNKRLEKYIRALRQRSALREKVIRHELGYLRPQEIMIQW